MSSKQENTPNTFIGELAERILNEHQNQLDRVTVIFPNRRAGLFFRQSLSEMISKPLWMPEVMSMQDFVGGFSSLETIETLEAIFSLYEAYQKHQQNDETFDQFFFWGEMILRDFEEIDQYLVNPEQLFTSIKSQKELDEEFYFLDEEDKRVIQSFWSSFLPKTTKSQEAFLETWKILLPVYTEFKSTLKNHNQAYGGMVYREVADTIASLDVSRHDKIYFAGFNALTHAEEKIIKHFVHELEAEVVWDLDDYYFSNPVQEAGFFMRAYADDSVLKKTFPAEIPKRFQQAKNLTATGVSLEVGQTKALAEKLNEICNEPDFDPKKTVVVLPQEHMLFPTLHAIPEAINKINITMGYPLKDTPVYTLLESVLQLQNLRKESLTKGVSFYFKPTIEVVEHPMLYSLDQDAIRDLVKEIRKRNRITLQQTEIKLNHPIFELIFQKPENPFDYLLTLLKELYDIWKEEERGLELEYISQFYKHLSGLHQMMGQRTEAMEYDFIIKLFRRLARSLKIPFTGEPLDGLQIMGILETRNLDFDRVFILNMNEDSWPAAARRGSFIPYNIRRAFDLPVFDHQDSIYAYLYYRLIQRAKDVHFYFNTVSEFNVNGELSRLVQQMEVESGLPIEKRILASPIKTISPKPIVVAKNEDVMQKMSRYLEGFRGGPGQHASGLTPSALNIYLDCKLKFYFKYVERLYEPDMVQEEMDPMVFGNILHDSMEILYDEFIKREKRRLIQPEDFFWIKEGVPGAINKAFMKHYNIKKEKKFELEGRSLIAADVLKKVIRQILTHDEAYAPFEILGLEADSKSGFELGFPIQIGGQTEQVKVKGIIDRIDIKEGKVRVIDYKTGRDERSFKNIDSLIDREDSKRNKAVFQVLFYSYLFKQKYHGTYEQIEPGLFNSRDLFKKDFKWQIELAKAPVHNFDLHEEDFEEALTELLTEMYHPQTVFDQTEDEKKCNYCPYNNICSR
ncbi:MAG: PD-(D/E)XK nuclease family protein [Cyclobacteriaceae bacterium]